MCNNSENATVEKVSREVQIKELYKSLGYLYVIDEYANPVEKRIISNFMPICGKNKNYICSCGYATQTKNKYCFICNRKYHYSTLNYLDKSIQFNGLFEEDTTFIKFNLLEDNAVELEYIKGRILFDCENFSFDFEGLKKEKLIISYEKNELHFNLNGKKIDFLALIPTSNMNEKKYNAFGLNLYKAISFLKDKPSYFKEMETNKGRLVFNIIYNIYLVDIPEQLTNAFDSHLEGFIGDIKRNDVSYYTKTNNTELFIKSIKYYDFKKLKGYNTITDALDLQQGVVTTLLNYGLLFNENFVKLYKKMKKKDRAMLNLNFEKNIENENFKQALNTLYRGTLIDYLFYTLVLIEVDWDEYMDYMTHLNTQEAIPFSTAIMYHANYLKSVMIKNKQTLTTTEEKFPINLKLKTKQVSK